MIVLSAKNISKSYLDGVNKLDVLKNLDFQLNKSEISVINGPSGSGKTTLLNILSTLDIPDKGEVQINGEVVKAYNKIQIDNIRVSQIGILFQSDHLLSEFTVLENLKIPYDLTFNENHHNPEDLLEKFSLLEKKNKYPHQLSGGERQRIALIRSIINNPDIVFADEPTGNLDKENLYIMIELMNEMKINYKTAFVIATHDKRLCDIADKIYDLDNYKLMINKQ